MKKYIALALTGALTLISMSASAQPGWRHHDDDSSHRLARVVRVEPISRLVRVAVPQTACYQRPIHHIRPAHRADGASLVGGIVGGIIGHNLDHGRGGATIAGAIVGAAVGRSLAYDRAGYYDTVSYKTRCYEHTRFQTREQRIGYRVTYRYHGRLYTTRMEHRPGRFIRLTAFYQRDDD
ncbi:MAG: hypothetical protein P8Z75_00900 [Gammaproteobacteria bacterium]